MSDRPNISCPEPHIGLSHKKWRGMHLERPCIPNWSTFFSSLVYYFKVWILTPVVHHVNDLSDLAVTQVKFVFFAHCVFRRQPKIVE